MLSRLTSTAAVLGAALALGAGPALADPPVAPANDDRAAATVIGALPAAVDATFAGATPEAEDPAFSGHRRRHTVWFRLAVPAGGTYLLDTCGTRTGASLAVLTAGADGAPPRVLTGPARECGLGMQLAVTAPAATTLWIAAAHPDGPDPLATPFTLEVERVTSPANDAFADAQVLRGPGIVKGNALLASKELGEPEHVAEDEGDGGESVWFRWRAPRTQRVELRTLASDFDPALGVFTGDLGRLRSIAANDDAHGYDAGLTFTAQRGRTYFIAVTTVSRTLSGAFELSLSDGGARGVGLAVAAAPGQTLDGVLARGLRTTIGCRVRCRVGLEAVVSRATARRLGLRSTVLARGGGPVRGGQELPAVLRLARAAAPALRRAGAVTVRLRATLHGTRAADRTLERVVRLAGPQG